LRGQGLHPVLVLVHGFTLQNARRWRV
jgi:hypothetical protein